MFIGMVDRVSYSACMAMRNKLGRPAMLPSSLSIIHHSWLRNWPWICTNGHRPATTGSRSICCTVAHSRFRVYTYCQKCEDTRLVRSLIKSFWLILFVLADACIFVSILVVLRSVVVRSSTTSASLFISTKKQKKKKSQNRSPSDVSGSKNVPGILQPG